MSTEECLEQTARVNASTELIDFCTFDFEDDDLPPTYEECVGPKSIDEENNDPKS
jgi:hypothetical protein